jgi:hypothetical protein
MISKGSDVLGRINVAFGFYVIFLVEMIPKWFMNCSMRVPTCITMFTLNRLLYHVRLM